MTTAILVLIVILVLAWRQLRKDLKDVSRLL